MPTKKGAWSRSTNGSCPRAGSDAFTDEPPGVTTEFTVRVVSPAVEHKITLQRVQQWAQPSTTGGPAMLVKRERLRKMLAESSVVT